VRVVVGSDNPERFAVDSVVFARAGRPGLAGPAATDLIRLTIESIRGSEGFPIIAFREVETREGAEGLRNHILEVRGEDLPDLGDDEFYPFDLIGLEVRDESGGVLGVITDAVESPAHALLVISTSKKDEILIPFVIAAIPTVDLVEGFLVVRPEFLPAVET